MLKNISKLEVTVGERVYNFLCDMDAPISHAKEAILKFLYYVNSIEEQAAQQQAAQGQDQSEKLEIATQEPSKES